MQQSTFMAVLEGVLIGNGVTHYDQYSETQTHQPWRLLLFEVAQQCGAGQSITEAFYGCRFRQLEQDSVAGCLLAALPVLMLNLDDHGHRRTFVSQWAKHLALSEGMVTALVELFECLCHVQNSHAFLHHGFRQMPWVNNLSSTELSTAILVDTYELLARVQGQLVPGLQIARRQGWESAEMGILALLAIVNSGPLAIPFRLRQTLKMTLPSIHDSSSLDQQRHLWRQVCFRLYQQRIGVSLDHDQAKTGGAIAVTI